MANPTRSVTVTVEWGNDMYGCPMARRTWDRIVKGLPVRRVEPYWYEGKRFTGVWTFNVGGYGRLEVTYDDDGQAFLGSLAEAVIEVDGSLVEWSDVALSNSSGASAA